MKRLFILCIIFIHAVSAVLAQAPQKFSYQAVVRDASNNLVCSQVVGVRISILQGGINGSPVFEEQHTVLTNANGLITLQIGNSTLLSGNIESIDWADGPYFLKSEIDPTGGTNYTIEGVQQLLSVPYALYAGSSANGFSGDYNDLTNKPTIPQIPANVSAFTNDAGYLTSYTEQQVLSISNDTIYLTGGSFVKLPVGFDGDYNHLFNKPSIPTVPTNVSAFNNDAGYLSSYTETDPQFNAWDKNYNDLTNKPSIPTVPTNVSAFINDAGYLTSYTEQQVLSINNDTIYLTGGSFVKLPVGFDGDYNHLTNKPSIPTVPTNISAFTNDSGYLTSYTETDPQFNAWDKNYNDLTNKPSIPTVPTNVSAFTNDAGYLTSYTEQQVLSISNDTIYLTGGSFVKLPSGFDGDYNHLTNKPSIPTVPTNISAFTNDSGYLTTYTETDPQFNAWDKNYNDLTNKPSIPTVPTNVSAFTNDAGYLTSYTEQQVLSISNDTIYLTGGSFVKLPAGFDGDYNHLFNKPSIPTVPTNVSAFTNDSGYLTSYTETDPQFNAWDKNYNDLTNKPSIPTVPTNVSAFTNDAGYLTRDSLVDNTTIPTNVSAFTNDAGYITADSLANLHNQLNEMQQTLDSLQQVFNENQFICGTSTVTDIDGNVYNTVRIGEQCWMKESLRTTHYADGTAIEIGTSTSTMTPFYYDYSAFDFPSEECGYLYNWPAVMKGSASSEANPSGVQGICPTGWHLPSDAEWTQLINYVSGQDEYVCGTNNTFIAKALASTSGWTSNSTTCTVGNMQSDNNATGFSALPIGNYNDSEANPPGYAVGFWSTTEASGTNAYFHLLIYHSATVYRESYSKSISLSVRCVCDNRSFGDNPQAVSEQVAAQQDMMNECVIDCPSTVTDIDGNVYNAVKIGDQCWMKENLRTTHYSDGTAIELGDSTSTIIPYRYTPGNNNVLTYGYLYNWSAVMNGAASSRANPSGVQGICPDGWHVPSDAEWSQLTNYVSRQDEYVCGNDKTNIAKALAATTGWDSSSNACAVGNTPSSNNATGFSVLPAGGYYFIGHSRIGDDANFWSATEGNSSFAYYRELNYFYATVYRGSNSTNTKDCGYSVRCLRNNSSVGNYLQGVSEQVAAQQSLIDSLVNLYNQLNTMQQYNDSIHATMQQQIDSLRRLGNRHVVISGQRYVCDQGPTSINILLTAFVDGGVDPYVTYKWYRDGMLEDNPYQMMYGAAFMGSFGTRYGFPYVFQLEIVDTNGVSSWSEPFEVTVMAPPVISIISNSDSVVMGGVVTLTAQLENQNVSEYQPQYQWYTSAITYENQISGATSAVYTAPVDETTEYFVTIRYLVENSNLPVCAASNNKVITVYEGAQPVTSMDEIQSMINNALNAMQQHNDSIHNAMQRQIDSLREQNAGMQQTIDSLQQAMEDNNSFSIIPNLSMTPNTHCAAPYSGSITVNAVSSAMRQFRYRVVKPSLDTTANQTENVFTGLQDGFYTVIIEDVITGNTAIDTISVPREFAMPRGSITAPDEVCMGNDAPIAFTTTDANVVFDYWSYSGPMSFYGSEQSFNLNSFPAGKHVFTANFHNSITQCANSISDTIRVIAVNIDLEVSDGTVGEDHMVVVSCRYYPQEEDDYIVSYIWNAYLWEYQSPGSFGTVLVMPSNSNNIVSVQATDTHGCTSSKSRVLNVWE